MDPKVELADVIVLAAGKGTRIGAEKNKMFIKISGIPILYRTLFRLNKITEINSIILVCREDEKKTIKDMITSYGELEKLKSYVTGGKERSDSVLKGLKHFVENSKVDVVMTHDGARPFITECIVQSLLALLETGSISIPVLPLHETIRKRVGSMQTMIINREDLFATQTPQVFNKKETNPCFFAPTAQRLKLTDEASYFEAAGKKVILVGGDKRNIKITTREDVDWAECLIKHYDDLKLVGFDLLKDDLCGR